MLLLWRKTAGPKLSDRTTCKETKILGRLIHLACPVLSKYPQIHHTIHFLSSTFQYCERQIFSYTQCDQVSAQCIQSASELELKHVHFNTWQTVQSRLLWMSLLQNMTVRTLHNADISGLHSSPDIISAARQGSDMMIWSHTTHVETDTYTGNQETRKLTGELKIKLTETVGTQTRLNCLLSFVLYILHATVMHTQVYSQLAAQLVLMLLHVSASKRSNVQWATDVKDMCSMLFRLSNINGKIFIHNSVIP